MSSKDGIEMSTNEGKADTTPLSVEKEDTSIDTWWVIQCFTLPDPETLPPEGEMYPEPVPEVPAEINESSYGDDEYYATDVHYCSEEMFDLALSRSHENTSMEECREAIKVVPP